MKVICDLMDCSSPGYSVHGVLQARILEWLAIRFFQGIFPTQGSKPGLLLAGRCFTAEPPGIVVEMVNTKYKTANLSMAHKQMKFISSMEEVYL